MDVQVLISSHKHLVGGQDETNGESTAQNPHLSVLRDSRNGPKQFGGLGEFLPKTQALGTGVGGYVHQIPILMTGQTKKI